MFLSFEGIDCCGKTTQIKLLANRLAETQHVVQLLREPGGTEISERIRAILLDKKHLNMTQISELFLFSAARAQLVNEVIKPALAKKTIIICDRFVDSTTAYQGYGRNLTLGAVKTINTVATFGTLPKKTFLLDITIQEMLDRRAASHQEVDRMELGNKEFFTRVRDGYLEMAANEKNRFVVINGKQSIETIHEEIWNVVENLITQQE